MEHPRRTESLLILRPAKLASRVLTAVLLPLLHLLLAIILALLVGDCLGDIVIVGRLQSCLLASRREDEIPDMRRSVRRSKATWILRGMKHTQP